MAKMRALLSYSTSTVSKVAAWPQGLVFEAQSGEPRGLLMPLISSARGLHELYGTVSRRKHFPEAYWQHMVLAARNTAAAFATLHEAGIVVGDVNQGNLLVDHLMCVRFIDCDSFQIGASDAVFKCPVGTPHFTPPELQSIKLDSVVRTPDHDGFGLAVLIFHLLFVGRHPFAGRVQGPSDLTIETAISQRLFAYSKKLSGNLVAPPPCSLMLDDIPASLATLFEAAFRGKDVSNGQRPPARLWAEELERLLRAERRCDLDLSHVHWKQLQNCPWCRIETQGGPSYFLAYNRAETIWEDRVAELERAIGQLPWTICPHIDPKSVVIPRLPEHIPPRSRLPLRRLDVVAWVAMASIACAVLCIVSPWLLFVAGLSAMGAGGFLGLDRSGRHLRQQVSTLRRELASLETRMRAAGGRLILESESLGRQFNAAFAPLYKSIRQFYLQGDELLERARETASQALQQRRAEYLQQYLVRDRVGVLPGLTRDKGLMLQRYGIETAYDIDPHMLHGIPNVNATLQMELVIWRNQIEENLASQPRAIGPVLDSPQQRAALIREFKAFQAQRVLLEAKQTKSKAQKLHTDLAHARSVFDLLVSQWNQAARQYFTVQRERRRVERWVNDRYWPLAILITGLLSATLAGYWIFWR
jgi:DNA-binding helix-hairpin-helix protein with protein kinase domain